jgi:hypothetical protein
MHMPCVHARTSKQTPTANIYHVTETKLERFSSKAPPLELRLSDEVAEPDTRGQRWENKNVLRNSRA